MPDQSSQSPHARGTLYVVLLAVLIGLSLMDRQILSIIAEPVKHEFGLSDTELGLLSGTIFALVFAAASIPIAWSADRISRTRILAVCATSWALCTMAMGAATGFVQLAAARMGLAVGEAGCNPCAQSLIADYVPVERRNRAMAIYVMGGPAGVIAAGIAGGLLTDAFGWRAALYALGAVSLAVALAAAYVLPEPKRKLPTQAATDENGFLARRRLGRLGTGLNYRRRHERRPRAMGRRRQPALRLALDGRPPTPRRPLLLARREDDRPGFHRLTDEPA